MKPAFGTFIEKDGLLWEVGPQLNNIIMLSYTVHHLAYHNGVCYTTGSSSLSNWVDVASF